MPAHGAGLDRAVLGQSGCNRGFALEGVLGVTLQLRAGLEVLTQDRRGSGEFVGLGRAVVLGTVRGSSPPAAATAAGW